MSIFIMTTCMDVNRLKLQNALTMLERFYVITRETAKRCGAVNLAWVAAATGEAKALAVLGGYGADFDASDLDGNSPVHVAAHNGHDKALVVLAEYDANFNTPNKEGITPAYIAAYKGYDKALVVLAEYGADLNVSDQSGMSPVLVAAYKGYDRVLAALSVYGVNLNVSDGNGFTPAYLAAQNGHELALVMLGECGADLNIPNKVGVTPTFIAAKKGYDKVLGVLGEYGVNLNAPCFFSSIELKEMVPPYALKIYARMEEFISTKLATGAAEDKIPVTPKDIAYIMGHEAAMAQIAAFTDLDALSHKKSIRFSEPAFAGGVTEKDSDNLTLMQKVIPK